MCCIGEVSHSVTAVTALLCLVQVDQAVEFIIDETFQVAGVSTTQIPKHLPPLSWWGCALLMVLHLRK